MNYRWDTLSHFSKTYES